MYRALSLGLMIWCLLPCARAQNTARPEKKVFDHFEWKLAGKLTADDPRDRLHHHSPRKTYLFPMSVGKSYAFDLASVEFDPCLRLEEASGKVVAEDDGQKEKKFARLVFQPEKTQQYRIIVTAFKPGQGSYTLKVRMEPAPIRVQKAPGEKRLDIPRPPAIKEPELREILPPPPDMKFAGAPAVLENKLAASDPLDEVIKSSPHKVHTVEVASGTAVVFDLKSQDFRPYLRLENYAGEVLGRGESTPSGDSRIHFHAEKSEIYRLIVAGHPGKTGGHGGYVLQARMADAAEQGWARFKTLKSRLVYKARDWNKAKSPQEQKIALSQLVGPIGESLDALTTIAQVHAQEPSGKETRKFLLEMVDFLGQTAEPVASQHLRRFMQKTSDKELQGLACYALARNLKKQHQNAFQKKDLISVKLGQEAEDALKLLGERHADLVTHQGRVGDFVPDALLEFKLAIGRKAPEIEGEDLDGKKFKLSDYQGKVVLLDFWSQG